MVGNIIVPIAGVRFAPTDISWFFFCIGLVFWLVPMTIVLYRLFLTARAAIIDSVLDYDPKSGRTSRESAEKAIAYVHPQGAGGDRAPTTV